jgi:hypothetical protein
MNHKEERAVITALAALALEEGECPESGILDEVAAGTLHAALAEPVAEHIETCADCREIVARLRDAHRLEAELTGRETDAPAGKLIAFPAKQGSPLRYAAGSLPDFISLAPFLPAGFAGKATSSVRRPRVASTFRISCLKEGVPQPQPVWLHAGSAVAGPEGFRESSGLWVAELELEAPWEKMAGWLKAHDVRIEFH